MKNIILRSMVLVAFAIVLAGRSSSAQDPKKTTYVPPFKLAVEPSVFRRDQPISVTANFTAPTTCSKPGLLLRVYEIDNTTGEPTFGGKNETKYLAQTAANYDPAPPAGTKVELTFDSLAVPSSAGEKVYLVVWTWCEIRIPKGVDENGNIIWQTQLAGTRVGGATYHFACPSQKDVCGYRAD
jgi:hypothetical protein